MNKAKGGDKNANREKRLRMVNLNHHRDRDAVHHRMAQSKRALQTSRPQQIV